eukprot:c12479_g1_i1 orf=61-1440(+)
MAHMLVAGLSSRGLSLLGLHRASWKVGCKQSLFVVGRIHPATLKAFPRSTKPQRASPPLNTYLPQQFALNCALSDPSVPPQSSSFDDPVIVSSKEYSDGSILFTFGNPGEQVSEDVTGDKDLVSKSGDDVEDAADAGHNGSITSDLTVEKKEAEADAKVELEAEAVPIDGTKSASQLDSLANEEVEHKAKQEVQINDACATTVEEPVESEKSIAKNEGGLRLRSGGAIRPHPSKVKTGGEDAYVIEGTSWAGVADGVGGWALSGVDSGLYSRELMTNCGLFAKSDNGVPSPKRVIINAVKKTDAVGTCTAVLAALHKQTLYVANIGDSGFLIVRNGKVLAKSTPMQHGFNFPYQIGSEGDDPAMAETFEIPVASGDVLVLATDGVYDNLYEREIVDVVDSGYRKGVEPGTVAMWLVKLAHQAGLNTEGRSPFSDAARAAGYSYEGGKLDDATVVVSYVE